jgi:hypothetical protein
MSRPIGHTEFCNNSKCKGNCQDKIGNKSIQALITELYNKQMPSCSAKKRKLPNQTFCRGHFKIKCKAENCFVVNFAIKTLINHNAINKKIDSAIDKKIDSAEIEKLATYITNELFNLGKEPNSSCHRIEFKGLNDNGSEKSQGGMNKNALIKFFIQNINKHFINRIKQLNSTSCQ